MTSKITYHNHHIIPRHMGGTDDPSNLIKLTIEEHAEAHRLLWEQYEKQEDRLAWLGLSGMISKEELIKEMSLQAGLKCMSLKVGIHHPDWDKRIGARLSRGLEVADTKIENGIQTVVKILEYILQKLNDFVNIIPHGIPVELLHPVLV